MKANPSNIWLLPFPGPLPWMRIIVSLFLTFLALGFRPYLQAILNQIPASLHYPAVFLAPWIGGLFSGLISTITCTLYTVVILRPHLLEAP